MPNTPKSNGEKMERIINAWETLAPSKSFGGMTLEQCKAVAEPAREARRRIANLEDQMTQAINDRDNGDQVFATRAQLIVNGVLADPTEGPDSSLYEAMGYTRKSERKSGLSRGNKQPPAGGTPAPRP